MSHRLKFIPKIGVDRISNTANTVHDPEILRLENLDTDILPSKIAIDVTKNSIDNELRKAAANHVSSIISAGGLSGILNCLLANVRAWR